MKLNRKWPLVVTASVMLIVPLMMILAIVVIGFSGGMGEVINSRGKEMKPWNFLWGLVVFIYPLYLSIQFLFLGKKSESIIHMLTCFVLLIAYLLIFYPLVKMGVTPDQTLGLIVFSVAAVFAYFFHRFLKDYCLGSPNQSR
jgi:hypothetical protein